MHSGRGRSFWWAGLLASVFAGCARHRLQIEQAVLANQPTPSHLQEIAGAYRARCPDVLAVSVAGLPHYSGPQRIGPDGRIHLGDGEYPRSAGVLPAGLAGGTPALPVDGQTTPEIAHSVARMLSVAPRQVHVEVAEYNSQYLYLFGQVAGMQRAVPYQGPETVLDLLRRVGGLTPGAAVRDIKVIRPHIADGKTPEVFRVDLPAILLHNDLESNVVLEPYDQVHIGQSRRSCFSDCLPPWMRPVYDRVCGMKRQP